ncbi:MAG: AAA family ATPase [Candidatus Competibacteraceae bacterium]|nr:AAA family ATPase [Candidatus Competibacteraceae bacterium]
MTELEENNTGVEMEVPMEEFFRLASQGGVYEVETPDGWVEVGRIIEKQGKRCYNVVLEDGKNLQASVDHMVETVNGWQKYEELAIGTVVHTKDGTSAVVSKTPIGIRDTFDIEVLSEQHCYYSNGIRSHNTGKTSIGHLICQQAQDSTVIWITPDLVYNNAQGRDSIKSLYKLADFVSPTVIILEDIDLFGEDRDASVGNIGLGGLMNILDGVNSVKNAVTVAMTNRIELIEKALSNRPGRFDRIVEIPYLNKYLRKMMFTDRLSDCNVEEEVLNYIVSHTAKWTGAEVQEFVNSLNMYFISNNLENDRVITQDVADHVLGTMSKFSLKESNMNEEGPKKVGFLINGSHDDD